MKAPFFITGCVRSGTTFLRDVLRRHSNLTAPEETHFYRWPEPFGSQHYNKILENNKVLIKHRELDGISENKFKHILGVSVSRADLYNRYMRLYINLQKPGATRWFDKTPQNVYGAAMIAMEFPSAKFVHIVRNPFDVVASLKVGKIMHVPQLVGACNYWNEAIEIMRVIKRAFPARVYEFRYEDFIADILPQTEKLLLFLGEEFDSANFDSLSVSERKYDYSELFSEEEKQKIRKLCSRYAIAFKYWDSEVA